MKVDVGKLPWRRAHDVIEWCIEHDVEREKCLDILSCLDEEWIIEVPDKQMMLFILKWDLRS